LDQKKIPSQNRSPGTVSSRSLENSPDNTADGKRTTRKSSDTTNPKAASGRQGTSVRAERGVAGGGAARLVPHPVQLGCVSSLSLPQ
jgi:hypothetical protein